ncbi:PREDICTED: serine/threonine-protein kinase STE20-like isoform X2 [Amphimedon queenslandica]|uniref:Protein kinase domain-containing protein n=1 Tax=Amphimedon queenslandica TaxID=400682 RepID=A0AAN0JFQ5_AMPQE|nr:PREDICTED: serine/threonine-protein kinase STE20-like isoform X2 [Amphimedon queenslandica]|eukprot:XP_019855622.1 PREDICTED: serine/threonine-protein kinase STE20-like isoform X2 [Amphimedon queenslandica]
MLPVFRLLSLLICTAVCVSTVNGQGQCPNGFIEQSSLPGLVNDAVTRPEGYLYLFFSVNFTCQVEVSSFILLATEDDGVGEYPFIQIWRETSTNLYDRIHNIGSSDEVTFLGNSSYQYTSTGGNTTVLPGDILGLLALSNSNSRVTPYLLNQSSPQYYERRAGGEQLTLTQVFANSQLNIRNQYLPLVAIELMVSFSSSISSTIQTTTTMITPTTTTTATISIATTTTPGASSNTLSLIVASSTTPSDSSSNAGMPSITSHQPTVTPLPPSFSSTIGTTPLGSLSSSSLSILLSSSSPSFTISTTLSSFSMTSLPSTSVLLSPPSSSLSSSPSTSPPPPSVSSSPSSSPPSSGSSVLTTAVISGVVVAVVLILIIIGLIFLLVLLFGLGRKRRRQKYSPTDDKTKDTFDNPNYTGVVSNTNVLSPSSTMTGDNFVTHYEIPGYQDPGLGSSTMPRETLYDVAQVPPPNSIVKKEGTNGAVYDEARPTGTKSGGITSIYHELGPDDGMHYEFGPTGTDTAPHYETNSGFIYEMETVPSGYEQPVISRSNTMKNHATTNNTPAPHPGNGTVSPGVNHYDVLEESLMGADPNASDTVNHYDVLDDVNSNSKDIHDYSVLSGKDIYVPTKEERRVVSQSETQLTESIYSLLEETQRQKYENVRFFEESDIYWRPACQASDLYDQLAKRKYREIRQNQLRLVKHLGSGQFGTVNEGVWHSPTGEVKVAIKMLPKACKEEEKIKLLQEAAIMGQFSHSNVVTLHGVVTVGEPLMIIMELMKNGDLRNHLLSIRKDLETSSDDLLPSKLLKFCQQIANGMNYLSMKSFVHRDLAARNVFLNDRFICKIGDFGMSRDLEDENYYVSHGGKVPVKWTAPEALLYKKYAPTTDVWSYGAVLYEMWSLGHKPFEEYSNQQYMEMIQTGYRLPPPPGCPRGIYQLMIHCWNPDSNHRPTFKDILDTLAEDPEGLLHWSDDNKAAHESSSVLGSDLEAGQDLYPELQQIFVKSKMKI